jgi:hypothetical protein
LNFSREDAKKTGTLLRAFVPSRLRVKSKLSNVLTETTNRDAAEVENEMTGSIRNTARTPNGAMQCLPATRK